MIHMNFENRLFHFVNSFKRFVVRCSITYSRWKALRLKKEVVRKKGISIVNRKTKKIIKVYAKRRFGSDSYWPYLALYTEIRGQFIEGWIPYDYYRYVLLPSFNPEDYSKLSFIKTFDYRVFSEFAVKPLYLFISGHLFTADLKIVDNVQLREDLHKYDNYIVIKEEFGMGGKQVSVMHSSEFIPEKLKVTINYVIQPLIKQHSILNDLYPNSVNTFRVVTFLKTSGIVIIKSVALRFGTDGSVVDNLSSGGQYIYFDSSGNPSKLSYNYLGLCKGDKHINTEFSFADISIPMFDDILEKCKIAHTKYPYTRLIAWDVCINEEGEPKLLEWNTSNPGFSEYESVFGPFFPDDDEILL